MSMEKAGIAKVVGLLTIDGFPKLESIFLVDAEGITKLIIKDCPNVETILVANNKLTEIEGLENLPKLKKLSFSGNLVKKIDLSKNPDLEQLYFFNNPQDLEIIGIGSLTKLTL